MTRQNVKKCGDEIEKVLKKYGVVTHRSARFDTTVAKFSFEIADIQACNKLTLTSPLESRAVDQYRITSGRAPIGLKVCIKGDRGEYMILKSRRTKYLVQDAQGKKYTVPFDICTLPKEAA